MLKDHFKNAWRNIIRQKVSTTINILGLSNSICAGVIIYLITSFELSFDRFHPDNERIYRIVGYEKDDQGKLGEIGYAIRPLLLAMRNELTGFERHHPSLSPNPNTLTSSNTSGCREMRRQH